MKSFLAILITAASVLSAAAADYLVVDLSGGRAADKWTVCDSAQPPALSDARCRTSELWLRRIGAGLACGVFEITQAQYRFATGLNPSRHRGDSRPVESVSWKDANAFAALVSNKTGLKFRLPTAAEWETACRAGTRTSFNNGVNPSSHHDRRIDEVCRYGYNRFDGRGGFSEHAVVGSFKPNAWGLYDMHGNVAEWCSDTKGKHPPVHPLMGGNWYECMESSSAFSCSSSSDMSDFFYSTDEYASDIAGFRLFCEIPQS